MTNWINFEDWQINITEIDPAAQTFVLDVINDNPRRRHLRANATPYYDSERGVRETDNGCASVGWQDTGDADDPGRNLRVRILFHDRNDGTIFEKRGTVIAENGFFRHPSEIIGIPIESERWKYGPWVVIDKYNNF